MSIRNLMLAAITLSFLAAPAFAQERSVDVTGFATWVDPTGNNRFRDANGNDFDIDFKKSDGVGLALNVFWSNRVSTEFAISSVKPEATFRSTNPAIPAFTGGTLRMIPITAVLQYHLAPSGRIDPYIGAGAAYVLFDQLDHPSDLDNVHFSSIDFKDDVGLAVNAGVTFRLTRMLALYADGKYVPVKSSAKAVYASGPGEGTKLDINPLMLSGGISLQF